MAELPSVLSACWQLSQLLTLLLTLLCWPAGMIAGGTGITPMYQVASIILKDSSDRDTRISLVYGSLTEGDILLKDELAALQAKHPKRFSVYHVLNTAPPDWAGGVGFITPDILKAHLPPPPSGDKEDIMVLRCGPPAMNEAMKKHLDALGYPESCQFQF